MLAMVSFHHLIHLHVLFLLLISISTQGCHEEERRALLDFQSSLEDPSNRLFSWQESNRYKNCCDWHGIECSRDSFHVISIDLRNVDLEIYSYAYDYDDRFPQYVLPPNTALQGKLSPSLLNISHLEYLDLAFNDFQASEFTFEFSYLTKLAHLDLSFSQISASISTQFTNLSSLQYLDLSCRTSFSYSTSCLDLSSTKWLTTLVHLNALKLSGIDFSFPRKHAQLVSSLYNLASLSILELSFCGLNGSIPYLPQLEALDVSSNYYLHSDLTNMFEYRWPKLQRLEVSSNKLDGSIPSSISNASLLVSLSASSCSFDGSLPSSLYSLSRLQYLDLSNNHITSYIHYSISNLKQLHFLDLSSNMFHGSIPKSICEIFPLRHLGLAYNNITGTIPSCIIKLRNLNVFNVGGNSITGTVSLFSLINELNLTSLDLSSNKLTVFIDRHIHPSVLTLESLQLGSCNMKGYIFTFICKLTHLKDLNLAHNSLIGAIPSCISQLKNLVRLDMSNNQLRGPLPLPPQGIDHFDLSHNKLDGGFSMEIGERLSHARYIRLYDNELTGSFPTSLCSRKLGTYSTKVQLINLSHNKLSGIIPSSIGYCTDLCFLNIGNNNLTGNVPKELALAENLGYLQLNDNNLNGTFPSCIQKLLNLEVVDLGNNSFEGNIPTGIGALSYLKFLFLRSNRFNGSIPEAIVHLQELQLLDLSINNFSGHIPRKIGNLIRLRSRPSSVSPEMWSVQYQLVIKGNMAQFKEMYTYISGIDLSCNYFNGSIPEEIGLLEGLGLLNLSHNHFSSSIPPSVGNMSSLEALDLSFNRLSGHIPKSLTSIDSLGFLNLSYNKLSGMIPRQNHFDTLSLDGSAFVGNDLLCGFPTEKVCEGHRNVYTIGANPSNEVDEVDHESLKEIMLLCTSIALGFVSGFWGLFFVLLLKKRKWWSPYWRAIDYVAVRVVQCCM